MDRGVERRENKQKQANLSEKGARDSFYASAAGIEWRGLKSHGDDGENDIEFCWPWRYTPHAIFSSKPTVKDGEHHDPSM